MLSRAEYEICQSGTGRGSGPNLEFKAPPAAPRGNSDKLVNTALTCVSQLENEQHRSRLDRLALLGGQGSPQHARDTASARRSVPRRVAAVSERSPELAARGAPCCLGFPGEYGGGGSEMTALPLAALQPDPSGIAVPTLPGARPTSGGEPGVRPEHLQSLGRAQGEGRPRTCPRARAQRLPAAAARPALCSTRPAARAWAPTAASASALRLLQRRTAMTPLRAAVTSGAAGRRALQVFERRAGSVLTLRLGSKPRGYPARGFVRRSVRLSVCHFLV